MVRPNAPQVQARTVREVFRLGDPGYWAHSEWEARFPWLVQGITGREASGSRGSWDFALFGEASSPEARDRWKSLASRLDFDLLVHSRQIHGTGVLAHTHRVGSPTGTAGEGRGPAPGGSAPDDGTALALGPDADGHICGAPGILLGVTVADCVPVFLVEPETRAVGLLHAGWRGAVAGILEEGIERLQTVLGARSENLFIHLGPAICKDCFEVGPEVHRAMGLPDPGGPRPVDLRGHLAGRGVAAGLDPDRITESAWCTRCDESPFFSHRRGERGRQVGFLGVRAVGGPAAAGHGGSW